MVMKYIKGQGTGRQVIHSIAKSMSQINRQCSKQRGTLTRTHENWQCMKTFSDKTLLMRQYGTYRQTN